MSRRVTTRKAELQAAGHGRALEVEVWRRRGSRWQAAGLLGWNILWAGLARSAGMSRATSQMALVSHGKPLSKG